MHDGDLAQPCTDEIEPDRGEYIVGRNRLACQPRRASTRTRAVYLAALGVRHATRTAPPSGTSAASSEVHVRKLSATIPPLLVTRTASFANDFASSALQCCSVM